MNKVLAHDRKRLHVLALFKAPASIELKCSFDFKDSPSTSKSAKLPQR